MSAMLCAALYPNVVQVGIVPPLCHTSKEQKAKQKYETFTLDVLQVRAPQGTYKKTGTGVMKMQPKANELRFVTKNDGYVHVHPSSVNYTVRLGGEKKIRSKLNNL